jgi:multidrug efflux system membrane fusion protein
MPGRLDGVCVTGDSVIGNAAHSRGLCTAAIVGVLLALAGCKKAAQPVAEPRQVQTISVALAPDDQESSYTGDVRARWESALGFRVPGKIVSRAVDVGAHVVKGQLLAKLDPEDQRLGAEAARQQLISARSDYEQAKADLIRYRDLFTKGFISAAEYDRRKWSYDTTAARLEQASAQLELTRNQTAYTQLHSDIDGVVTAVQAEAGQVVIPGQPVVKVARLEQKEVAVNVPENRLDELKSAQDVDITLWAAPGKTYQGRIREISPSADNVTRTYTVKVTVLDPDAAVQLGMTANVFLKRSGTHARVARLPLTALFQNSNQPAVWLVDPKTSQVSLRAVQIGRYTQDYVTVVSGLKEGDVVVRAGVHKLNLGETVRAVSQSAELPSAAR